MSEDSMPISNKRLDDHRSIFIIIFMDTLSLAKGLLPKKGRNTSPSKANVTKKSNLQCFSQVKIIKYFKECNAAMPT